MLKIMNSAKLINYLCFVKNEFKKQQIQPLRGCIYVEYVSPRAHNRGYPPAWRRRAGSNIILSEHQSRNSVRIYAVGTSKELR
jgi:hypothetical protein